MSWNTTTWIIWSTNENKELADRFFTYMGFERADRVFILNWVGDVFSFMILTRIICSASQTRFSRVQP